ncbi:MAG: preprotein translocase subunit SecY [Verrucomicrobiota bacterium]|nr:preprotein translocase subunit SecY [Verrucomicrobiota bacterium]
MFRNIVNTFANCFKIPELKSRILFTAGVLAVCRLIAFIRMPGLNGTALSDFFNHNAQGGALGMMNMFAGGGLENCAIGGIGIMPYISATIILQLLTAVIPQLSKLAREENGRTKIIQYGRYFTVPLCLGWGLVTAIGYEHPAKVFGQGIGVSTLVLYSANHIWWYRIQTTLLLTTGTMLLMWLGEQISDRGIGNGVSLIITVNILARLPSAWQGVKDMFFTPGAQSQFNIGHAAALVLLLVGVVAGVIAVTQAQRKVPVQYAQRAVGRKLYSGGTSFLPLRVNYSGVMPIIFAQSILMFPQRIFVGLAAWLNVPFFDDIARVLNFGSPVYLAVYSLMILFFSYFWVATQFNELQIADDLKKNGGYIPGVRPGQSTSDYLHRAMSRITLAGAIFLTIIAVIPIMLQNQMHIPYYVSSFFGGTSILITVGVLLDTMRQVEAHLMMRHYDGFLKKGRLRGRF